MKPPAFNRFETRDSPVHRLDPRIKVLISLLFIVSTLLLPDGAWLAYLLSFAVLLAISSQSGLGASYSLKRSVIAAPFALAAVSVIFALPGRPLADWQVGPYHLVATDSGLLRFASILARSWLSVQVAILLVATTRFPDLMHALRHLRVPAVLVAVISFLYRYLFVMADEALRLMRARASRSARLPARAGDRDGTGTKSPARRVSPARQAGIALKARIALNARVTGQMVGQLFLRSFERSDRVYNAMLARGYQGQLLTLNPHAMRAMDWEAAAGMAGVMVVIQVIGRL